jgi:3-methyladenine DNA glycosylase AlkD
MQRGIPIAYERRPSVAGGIVAIVDELVRAMDAAASPENARALARYFKVAPGSYGEGDIFLGLKLGELRQLAKPYLNSAFDPEQWLSMLHSPIHEHRLITLVVMSERAKKLAKRDDDDELRLIYDSYLGNTSHVNNWDLVDISCGPIVGGYLLDRDRSPLYGLARSGLLWDRRIAMVGSQRFLRRRETSDLYRLAEILLPDRHDLIHKAVGWSLREASKKVDADELRRFLDQHVATMPRTALRYAIEHFDPAERQHYLSLPRTPTSNAFARTEGLGPC